MKKVLISFFFSLFSSNLTSKYKKRTLLKHLIDMSLVKYSKTSLLCVHRDEKFITSRRKSEYIRVRLRFNDIRIKINYTKHACWFLISIHSQKKCLKLDRVGSEKSFLLVNSSALVSNFKWPGINLTVILLLHDDIFMIFFLFSFNVELIAPSNNSLLYSIYLNTRSITLCIIVELLWHSMWLY